MLFNFNIYNFLVICYIFFIFMLIIVDLFIIIINRGAENKNAIKKKEIKVVKEIQMLTTNQLAERWNIKPQTLRNWRRLAKGPKYVLIGDNIRYSIETIEKYEKENQS